MRKIEVTLLSCLNNVTIITKNIMSKQKILPLVLLFDIETNGLPITKQGTYHSYYPYTDLQKYDCSRIIAMSWAVHDFKGDRKLLRTMYVKPDGFTIDNSEIHGITLEKANNDGQSIGQVFKQFEKDLTDVKVMVAHNLEFDLNILLSELHRFGNKQALIKRIEQLEKSCTGEQTRDLLKIPFKSSYVIAKYKMPKLDELFKYCFKIDMVGHHNVEQDVDNLSKIFFHLLKN